MLKADLNTGRLLVNEYPEGVEVIVTAKKSEFVNLFLALWMVGWIYGVLAVMGKILNHTGQSADAFTIFWLCGWTLGGLFAVVMWLRNNKGREIVKISDNELKHCRDYVWFSRSNVYGIKNVKNLRVYRLVPTMDTMSEGMEFWGLSGGAIAFDYGINSHKFGLGLDETQAGHVIKIVKRRYKFL